MWTFNERTAQSKKRPDWDRCHMWAVHWLAKKALRQRLLLVSNQPGTACKSKSLTRAATPDGVQEEGAVMIIGAKSIIDWNQRHSNKLVKALDARKSIYSKCRDQKQMLACTAKGQLKPLCNQHMARLRWKLRLLPINRGKKIEEKLKE